METLLLRGVAGEVPLGAVAELCGITPIERPADWVRTASGWTAPAGTGTRDPLDPAGAGEDLGPAGTRNPLGPAGAGEDLDPAVAEGGGR